MASRSQPAGILCFDFDGTLVDHEESPAFDPAFREALRAMVDRSYLWAINTGRSLRHTLEGIDEFGLGLEPDYIIANERELYAPSAEGKWEDVGDWNARCLALHEEFFGQHTAFFAQLRDYIEEEIGAFYVEEAGMPGGVIAAHLNQIDRIVHLLEEGRKTIPDLHYQRNAIYLRFAHQDYHKGAVLREVARLHDIAPEYILAAGDNYNDLSMLDRAVAGKVACPANAVPAVKEQVRAMEGFVAEKRCSQGLGEILVHFFK